MANYYCEIHDEQFEHRTWCPLCEIAYELREGSQAGDQDGV